MKCRSQLPPGGDLGGTGGLGLGHDINLKGLLLGCRPLQGFLRLTTRHYTAGEPPAAGLSWAPRGHRGAAAGRTNSSCSFGGITRPG